MLYIIMLVVYLLLCYFYVKILVLEALSLSVSLIFFHFFVLNIFLVFRWVSVFAIVHKRNISCTAVYSPYVFRHILHLQLLSRAKEDFTRKESILKKYTKNQWLRTMKGARKNT